jgi:hypothetical protein
MANILPVVAQIHLRKNIISACFYALLKRGDKWTLGNEDIWAVLLLGEI